MEASTPTLSPEKKESKWVVDLKKYLKQNFSLKNNLWRLLWIIVGVSIALIPTLTCNLLIRHGQTPWLISHRVDNNGIAFGMNMPAAGIYALQSVICILIAVAIVFNTKWYYVILLSLAFLGGFFNIIDRAANHGYVIDYLPTGGTTSNFADVFILIGIIGFGVIYIIMSIIAVVNEKKEAKVEQPTSDNPSAPKVD